VYKTLWVNPHPDKRIDKIVLTNAGLPDTQWRFVPHLAITLAMAPTGSALKPTGDAAKAKALISEATSALESKDTPKAITKLEQAIAADGANTGAWQLLTSLRAKTDEAKTFIALCRRWMAADPKNYQPYNALGAFLEQHGQAEEALKLYKRSLEIEWNQPPTAEAVRRLDSALKK
jgi:Tfp pilus assembly protein PilF